MKFRLSHHKYSPMLKGFKVEKGKKEIAFELNKMVSTVLADSVAITSRAGGIQLNFFNFLTENADKIHMLEQARVFIAENHAKEFVDQLCTQLNYYPPEKKEQIPEKKKK